MDLEQGSSSKEGPSRFGSYFGSSAGSPDAYSTSGTANSGYDEVYVFYMVKYPSNAFPKDGGTYEYFSYDKFHVLATGFFVAATTTEIRAIFEHCQLTKEIGGDIKTSYYWKDPVTGGQVTFKMCPQVFH